MFHGDPDNPKKNAHPIKRYEVTATVEAPEPRDKVNGRVYFDVVSTACLQENKFLGVYIRPSNAFIDFEMARVSRHIWKGYFYRDAMLDEDYYGRGSCHWEITSVSVGFTAQGKPFSSGLMLEEILRGEAHSAYYRKRDISETQSTAPPLSFFSEDPEVAQQPEAFYLITVAVKEAIP